MAVVELTEGAPVETDRRSLPEGLPSLPAPRTRNRRSAVGLAAVAAAPLILMLVSVLVGGGPRTESADDALITMASRDIAHRAIFLGPYSRFGWHHPGPTYFYLLSIPTWLWHAGPTGTWIGASCIGVACAIATVLVARRWAGPRAGWWVAAGVLAVVAGLGPGLFRDPWNPYVVTLPVLFVLVACALAVTGARGLLAWAAVVASLAVQTHVSTLPVLGGVLLFAAAVQGVRAVRRRARGGAHIGEDHIPANLPALDLPASDLPWWKYRPELAIAVMVLIAEWTPPLWDQVFGTGNLGSLLSFFTSPHPQHGWADSWRLVTAMASITMFQHHRAVQDGVAAVHPVLTTIAFLALVVVAIGTGVARRRPAAVWLGAFGLLGAVLGIVSVTRVIGEPYRYLLVWMAVLPVVPLAGAAVGLQGVWSEAAADDPASADRDAADADPARLRPAALVRPGSAIVAGLVVFVSFLALRATADATPAARLTDNDVAQAWHLIAPVVGGGHDPVRIEIADGGRWPATAGIALELERHGHPARVAKQWAFVFGASRTSNGTEPTDLVIAPSDSGSWPPASTAHLLGRAGPNWVFVRRAGTPCWWGWVPFGGPACPPPAVIQGPAVPLPLGGL